MQNTYNFIINSFQELEDLKFFIYFLSSKKKKIVFFIQRVGSNEKIKSPIIKSDIGRILKKFYEVKTFLPGRFPIKKINNANNIVISTHPYSLFFGESKKNFLFVFFQSFLDSLSLLKEADLKNIDLFFFHTKYWKKILNKYYKKKILLIRNKTYYYGYYRFKNSTLEKNKVKKLYNINTNKKILLLFYGNFNKWNSIYNAILNFSNQKERFYRFVINMIKFKKISFRACKLLFKNIQINNFIDKIDQIKKKNNYYLILKLRKKSIPQNILMKIADKVIIDNPYYTFASDNLTKISNFIIHFSSTSILSSIYYGKQNLSIIKPVDESLEKNKKIFFFYNLIRQKKNSVFNYKKLTKQISFEDFVNSKNLNRFNNINYLINKKEKNSYIRKFIENRKYSLNLKKIYRIIERKLYEKNSL